MEDQLFRVEIDENGQNWIRRFRSLALVILVVTILVSGLNLFYTFDFYRKTSHGSMTGSNGWRLVGSLIFAAATFLLQVVQVSFYRRFAVRCSRAVDNHDSVEFNGSFRWLFYQSVCFLLQVAGSFLYFVSTFFLYRY